MDKTHPAGSSAPSSADKSKIISEKVRILPRFLIIKKIDQSNFEKTNPFFISKSLYGLVGELKDIKKVKEGLLVQTVSNSQSNRLLGLKTFLESPVEVNAHKSLNFSKGVIYCRDLLNCTIDEAKIELEPEGVIDIKRITKKVEDEIRDTPLHIVTFNTPTLPKKMKIAFHCVEVRPYIPNPLRCFKCFRFGHISELCRETQQFCICGLPTHEGIDCQNPKSCVNCNLPHASNSRDCERYKTEMAIQKLKTIEKISYFEAKRKINSLPTYNISYSNVVKTDTTPEIIKKITPLIVETVKECLKNELPIQNKPSFKKPLPEKRKRDENNLTVSENDTNDEDLCSQTSNASTTNKRKNINPRRPRKPPDLR